MPFRWMPAQGNLVTLCGGAALTLGPSFDPLTPDEQISDGRPATPVRFGAAAAAPEIGVRLNLLRNPGFEIEDLADWPVLSGTSARTTDVGEIASGAAALEITAAGGRYQDVQIPSGIPFRVLAALRGDGVNAAFVVVLNLDTGRFLNSAGAWVADTTVRTLSQTANTYFDPSVAGTVETFAQTGRYLTRLRVHVGGDAASTFIDDVAVRPSWNFVGIIGHNLTGRGEYRTAGEFNYYGQVPRMEYQSSEDTVTFGWVVPGGAQILEDGQAYTIPAPNTWHAFDGGAFNSDSIAVAFLSDQYAHYPAVQLGELVVGYLEDLVPAMFPMSVRMSEAGQVRNETPSGDLYIYNSGPRALRELSLRWIFNTDAAQEILRDRLYQVSRGGAEGLIIVPPAELVTQVGCIFGVPAQDFTISIDAPIGGPGGPSFARTASLVIQELPSPDSADL